MPELSNTDIIILAGGLGKRLSTVTNGGQKVLAAIDGKPFLSILIDYIASQGGSRFIICTGHGAEQVEQQLQKAHPNVELIFSREQTPLGTGGAIKKAAVLVTARRFLAMNGDCFCAIDYNALIDFHLKCKANATLAVTRVEDAREYGTIEFDEAKHITAFKEKQPEAVPAFINTGTYCFNREVFALAPTSEKFSIEYDFFPRLVGKDFYAFEVEGKFIDIGTPERYAWAKEHLKELRGRHT